MRKRFAVIITKIVYPKKRDSTGSLFLHIKAIKRHMYCAKSRKWFFAAEICRKMLKTVISRIYNK